MAKQSEVIIQSTNTGISRIKLNGSDTYNALSSDMLKLLIKNFKELNDNDNTKVIIIEGLGKGFSSGHNLKEIRSIKKKNKP